MEMLNPVPASLAMKGEIGLRSSASAPSSNERSQEKSEYGEHWGRRISSSSSFVA